MNGAVFKTVSETVRAGSGRFDSYTPPPKELRIAEFGLRICSYGRGGHEEKNASVFAPTDVPQIAKMGIVEEEADESSYWIELLIDAGIVKRERIADLLQESDEIVSIVVSSIKTARTDSTKPVLKSAIRNPQSEVI